ncbi:MAG: hypothetical protein HOH20_13490 [Rhodospirillaceae bacterium]|nr:hypothetical protein [Rhodospirillaceae bacterium]MBT5239239.1 hypothetical protein [Rhodospirillaceae bacterium]MBT6090586.1 hypothetical protein [Rhodospirillaceae bacterium]
MPYQLSSRIVSKVLSDGNNLNITFFKFALVNSKADGVSKEPGLAMDYDNIKGFLRIASI